MFFSIISNLCVFVTTFMLKKSTCGSGWCRCRSCWSGWCCCCTSFSCRWRSSCSCCTCFRCRSCRCCFRTTKWTILFEVIPEVWETWPAWVAWRLWRSGSRLRLVTFFTTTARRLETATEITTSAKCCQNRFVYEQEKNDGNGRKNNKSLHFFADDCLLNPLRDCWE